LFARGATFGLNLLLVPLSLQFLGTTDYGVWIALSSVVGWIGMLDIGIGNGLRNRVAGLLAEGKRNEAKAYVSTAYVYLGGGALLLTGLFEAVNPILDWVGILNASGHVQSELRLVAALVFGVWGLRLVLGLLFSVLQADQRPAVVSGVELATTAIATIGVWFLTTSSPRSVFTYALVVALPIVVLPLLASLGLYGGRYENIRPAFSSVNKAFARDLISLGVKFFALQIGVVIQFTSATIIIAQLFGPSSVTPYTIASKYFNAPLILFLTLLTPFWSAYTDAYVKGERDWIRRSIRRLKRIWLVLLVSVFAMMFVADWVYKVWIGTEVKIDFLLSLGLGLYVIMQSWCAIHVNLINGVGLVWLEMMLAIATTVLFIPVAVLLALHVIPGPAGVVGGMCVLLVPSCILWPIQTRKILDNTASGVWAR
jgi:O-antigen/teichoic acid export membrane protein